MITWKKILALVLAVFCTCYVPQATADSVQISTADKLLVTEIIQSTNEYEQVGKYSDGLAAAKKDGKWGYVNRVGRVVVPFEYGYAGTFNNGFAVVGTESWGIGKFGIIDTTGKIIISLNYDAVSVPLHDYIISEFNGFFKVGLGAAYGLLDTHGNIVVPIEYADVSSFSNGLACVKIYEGTSEKYGFVDEAGEVAIGLEYDYANSFNNGLARVRKGDKWGYINTAGEIAIPIEYDRTYQYSEGVAAVSRDGKWGYADATGNVMISFEYDYVSPFSDGLACVSIGDKYGFINKTGVTVIPFEYNDAFPYEDGLARVKKDGKWGFIDVAEKVVVSLEYDSVGVYSDNAAYKGEISHGNGLARVRKDGKDGLVDKTGKIVVPVLYDYVESSFDSDIALVKQDGKYGLINRAGEVVLPIEYDRIPHDNESNKLFSDGITWVMKDGKWGLIQLVKNVTFNDVPDEEWYADAIDYLVARGIVDGIGEGVFNPHGGATRAQLVKIICKRYVIEPINDSDNFADAYGSDGEPVWYTSYLAAAKQAGIIQGVGDNKFNPDAPLTRQEMFTMMYRALTKLNILPVGEGRGIATFDDYQSVDDWAEEAMAYFTVNGIIQGYDNKLDPLKPASRAEMSQVLYNIMTAPQESGYNEFAGLSEEQIAQIK